MTRNLAMIAVVVLLSTICVPLVILLAAIALCLWVWNRLWFATLVLEMRTGRQSAPAIRVPESRPRKHGSHFSSFRLTVPFFDPPIADDFQIETADEKTVRIQNSLSGTGSGRGNEEQFLDTLNGLGKDGWRLNRFYGETGLRSIMSWKGGLNLLLEREAAA